MSVERAITDYELLVNVPRGLRARIISGMRWTLWLSVLAAPFGFASSIILARVGPEAIGTYGLLTLYLGVVSGLFYLGGDAVLIKFLPETDVPRRRAFLVSYFLVAVAALLPWIVAASLWPHMLRYVFGDRIPAGFALFALAMSPVFIAYSMVAAALKAELEMLWAKALLRGITVSSFCCYCALFIAAPSLLRAHSRELIWGIYLALAAVAACLGLLRLTCILGRRVSFHDFRLALPKGFWRYTLSLQQQSMLSVISLRIDYVLVLNFGGLAELGKYVALMAVAQVVGMTSTYFAEPLLPAMTNVLATGDRKAASDVFSTTLRILFAVNAATVFGLIFFMNSVIALLGSAYAQLRVPCILMVALLGIAAPGASGGTLLTSVGRQQRSVWVVLAKIVVFVALFPPLWHRWHLLGAVIACGLVRALEGVLLLTTARYSTSVRFSGLREYALLISLTALVALLGIMRPPISMLEALFSSVVSLAAFLWAAAYRPPECRRLLGCFLPPWFLRVWANRQVFGHQG